MKRGPPESRERGKRHSFPPRALSQIPEKSGCGHELVESRPAEGLDSKQQGFMNQPYSFSPPSFPSPLPDCPDPSWIFCITPALRGKSAFSSHSQAYGFRSSKAEVPMQTAPGFWLWAGEHACPLWLGEMIRVDERSLDCCLFSSKLSIFNFGRLAESRS